MNTLYTDLKLTSGDLEGTINGGLALVSDLDAIWQSVILRLTTTLGTNIFAPNYGTRLGRYVDEPLTDDLKEKIYTEVKTTILQDPRVKSISNIQVVQNNGFLIYLTIVAVTGGIKSGSVQIGG
jgi:phage baseplate assembly protein W